MNIAIQLLKSILVMTIFMGDALPVVVVVTNHHPTPVPKSRHTTGTSVRGSNDSSLDQNRMKNSFLLNQRQLFHNVLFGRRRKSSHGLSTTRNASTTIVVAHNMEDSGIHNGDEVQLKQQQNVRHNGE